MYKKITTILASAFIFTLTGCGAGASGGLPDMNMRYSSLGFNLIESNEAADSFTMITDSNMAVLSCNYETMSSVFTLYENTSVIKTQVYDTVYSGICYDNNNFYSFNTLDHSLVMFDGDFQIVNVLLRDLEFFEVKNLFYSNNKLFFLLAHVQYEGHTQSIMDANGFIDFGEAAYCYDLNAGEYTNLKIKGVTAQSISPDGHIYYYCYDGNNYSLNRYIDNGKIEKIRSMNEIGYVYGFAFYGQTFVYADNAGLLTFKEFTAGIETIKRHGIQFYHGSDIQIYNGNIIFISRLENTIDVIYLGDGTESNSDSIYTTKNKGVKLVVGANSAKYMPYDFSALNMDIDMNVSVYQYPVNGDEMKMKLMAGDGDVDIYILTSDFYTPAVKNNKLYIPLNDSSILSSYLNDCFDYISDYFTDDGNIWGVPISANTVVTWYVPQNLIKFNLTYDDVKMFDSYMETSKQLKGNTGGQEYFNEVESLHPYLHDKYDVNYNNFKNNYVNYNTDIYSNFYESLRNNWIRFTGPYSEHPYFNNPYHYWIKYTDSIDDKSKKTERFDFNEDMVIFNTTYTADSTGIDTRSSLKNWRAFPAPMLSQENEKSPVLLQYAVVNPHGENIPAAREYLEFLIRYRNKYISKERLFMMKDINLYAGLYDIKEPCFNDLYEIFMNGGVSEPPFWSNEYQADIENYQKGLMTIEEVTANLQRKAEMALFE